MKVLKFGGTSVETAERIRDVVSIVADQRGSEPVIVVVSAMAGVTNALVDAATRAAASDPEAESVVRGLAERHAAAARAVASPEEVDALIELLAGWQSDLRSLIQGISLVRDCSPRVLDAVLSYGELFSSALVTAAFRRAGIPAQAIDARKLIITDDTFGNAKVDRALTDERVRQSGLRDGGCIPVVTGFIAATSDGTTTTLGRGGSDYT
ncbi:MAG: bifunctional aspartate kinase/homoserine dehydrogenase I, partial [Longimicrobiales bacterium]